MKTIEEFCETHRACSGGREWARAHCKDMQHVWDTARPDRLIWIATRPGVLTDSELRQSAIFCARSVEHLLTDERSRHAIDVAERFLNGKATAEELEAATKDAVRVATDASRVDVRAAATTAAWAVADAVMAAYADDPLADVKAVTTDAVVATIKAVKDDVKDDVKAAARADQAAWLRANTKPTF